MKAFSHHIYCLLMFSIDLNADVILVTADAGNQLSCLCDLISRITIINPLLSEIITFSFLSNGLAPSALVTFQHSFIKFVFLSFIYLFFLLSCLHLLFLWECLGMSFMGMSENGQTVCKNPTSVMPRIETICL